MFHQMISRQSKLRTARQGSADDYLYKITRDSIWRKLFLSATLLGCMALHQGCATTERIPLNPAPESAPPVVIVLSFGPEAGRQPPKELPVNHKELVLCALYDYDHGNFAEAARAFEDATKGIVNPLSLFRREALMASAISYLRDGDDYEFIRVMEILLSSYNRYELSQAREEDPRMRVLEEVYNQRSKKIQNARR